MPLVSVLTAVHADSPEKVQWLGEAMQSVLNQELTDWEMVILDDCSSRDLGSLRQEFNDGRFRWFRGTKQQGPSLCRNTAAALAESEALIALDADDAFFDEKSLGILYESWAENKKRVVYGDIQRFLFRDGGFRRENIVNLPSYTFQRALNLQGIIPVTAIHSINCHIKAGGWKPVFEAGLEDIEYWIAAGKAGFCGHHVSEPILVYRRHDTSRAFHMRRVNRRESEMRSLIRQMHQDVYEGRYPMGCCGGGGRSASTYRGNPASSQVQRATTLDQYPTTEKVWVQYQGKRAAAFHVVGQFSEISYRIEGPGHKLEVHRNDLSKFRRSGRFRGGGRQPDFAIGVAPPPEAAQAIIEEKPKQEEPYQAPSPQLAEIERLDSRALQKGIERAEVEQPKSPQMGESLASLNLGAIQNRLEQDGWTIAKLAEADVGDLVSYKGIGFVRAGQIINRAQEALR